MYDLFPLYNRMSYTIYVLHVKSYTSYNNVHLRHYVLAFLVPGV
jgi:hypothetical protein